MMRIVVENIDNLYQGQGICYISTGDEQLNQYLGGGIPCGNIIQLVGPSAAGKSQFCMQLVAHLRANDDTSACAFISNGKKSFHSTRFLEMAHAFGSTKSDLELLENIHVSERTTLPGLEKILNESLIKFEKLKLLFLEDLELVLPDITDNEMDVQMLFLHKLAVLLKKIANIFNAAVIVVNGVRFDPIIKSPTSTLGLSWKMYFTYRLWMDVIEKEPRQRFNMKFTGIIDDVKSVEAVKSWSTLVISITVSLDGMVIASKYSTSTKFTILLTAAGWSFICAVPVQCGHYIELKLSEKEVFSKFSFEGHSKKMDFIVFSISRSHFAQLFQHNSHVIKFKLCTRHNSPHLAVDLKTIGITSIIPVNFLFEFGEDYIAPTIKENCLALCATPLPTVIKTFTALSQLKIEEIYLSMYQLGKIKFSADSDHSTYKLILSDLDILDESDLQEDIHNLRFDLKMLQLFFTSLPQEEEKFFMRMSANGLLQILFKYKYVTASLVTRCHREIEED